MKSALSERARGRLRRHLRVRKKITGTPEAPRLAVFRSNRHIYAQLVDDHSGSTLAYASTVGDVPIEGSPKERARRVGRQLAERAKSKGVTKVRFDRGGFRYHGRVAEVAEGAREGGLEF